MKNTLKTKLFEAVEKSLAEVYPEIEEVKRRKIASLIQSLCSQIFIENMEGLGESHADIAVQMESHKKMFKDHIESLQKDCKSLMETFKTNGMVTVQIDPKTYKPALKAKTTVIAEMVILLNKLNELTMDFYENVYKIEESKDNNIQTTLF